MSVEESKLKEVTDESHTDAASLEKRRRTHHLLFTTTMMTFVMFLFPLVFMNSPSLRCELFGDSHCKSAKHTVLLISMDGFRHDYIEKVKQRLGPNSLENFDRFIKQGVRVLRSVNAYPTITLPNHQTLITGLYPEYHGVVGNNLIDTNLKNDTFQMNDQESLNNSPWLENWPEPVWVTAQKNGHLVGSLLWPLTDGLVHNDRPFQQVSQFTLLDSKDVEYDHAKRVDDVLWWLQNPYFHLDLILAYFGEPDETGHAFGPDSNEVASVVKMLDERVGQLLDGIEARGLTDEVDIIITSDHGMSSVSKTRLIELDKLVNKDWYNYTQLSTMGFLYPLPNKFDVVYNHLKNANPHLRVYRLSEVPGYLNFNVSNTRMPGLVLIPDPLWEIVHNASANLSKIAGDHGYATSFNEMHPFFIAKGPSFSKRRTFNEIRSVDVYPLVCYLLGIKPNPNNGSLNNMLPLLDPKLADQIIDDSKPELIHLNSENLTPVIIVAIISVSTLCVLIYAIVLAKRRRIFEDNEDTVEIWTPASKEELCV